ncbi:MAG: Txe/YoeB family addiction module toxin [Acidobacteria bacterium]|nr:MAG: Txe/YoeB family addiction module toxin [Acidobacteriota bacterium]
MSHKNTLSFNHNTQKDPVFQPEFKDDLKYWVKTDRKTAVRVFRLIESVMRDPYQGMGKPVILKSLGSAILSRRITQEHRLVYVVVNDQIVFAQARYLY